MRVKIVHAFRSVGGRETDVWRILKVVDGKHMKVWPTPTVFDLDSALLNGMFVDLLGINANTVYTELPSYLTFSPRAEVLLAEAGMIRTVSDGGFIVKTDPALFPTRLNEQTNILEPIFDLHHDLFPTNRLDTTALANAYGHFDTLYADTEKTEFFKVVAANINVDKLLAGAQKTDAETLFPLDTDALARLLQSRKISIQHGHTWTAQAGPVMLYAVKTGIEHAVPLFAFLDPNNAQAVLDGTDKFISTLIQADHIVSKTVLSDTDLQSPILLETDPLVADSRQTSWNAQTPLVILADPKTFIGCLSGASLNYPTIIDARTTEANASNIVGDAMSALMLVTDANEASTIVSSIFKFFGALAQGIVTEATTSTHIIDADVLLPLVADCVSGLGVNADFNAYQLLSIIIGAVTAETETSSTSRQLLICVDASVAPGSGLATEGTTKMPLLILADPNTLIGASTGTNSNTSLVVLTDLTNATAQSVDLNETLSNLLHVQAITALSSAERGGGTAAILCFANLTSALGSEAQSTTASVPIFDVDAIGAAVGYVTFGSTQGLQTDTHGRIADAKHEEIMSVGNGTLEVCASLPNALHDNVSVGAAGMSDGQPSLSETQHQSSGAAASVGFDGECNISDVISHHGVVSAQANALLHPDTLTIRRMDFTRSLLSTLFAEPYYEYGNSTSANTIPGVFAHLLHALLSAKAGSAERPNPHSAFVICAHDVLTGLPIFDKTSIFAILDLQPDQAISDKSDLAVHQSQSSNVTPSLFDGRVYDAGGYGSTIVNVEGACSDADHISLKSCAPPSASVFPSCSDGLDFLAARIAAAVSVDAIPTKCETYHYDGVANLGAPLVAEWDFYIAVPSGHDSIVPVAHRIKHVLLNIETGNCEWNSGNVGVVSCCFDDGHVLESDADSVVLGFAAIAHSLSPVLDHEMISAQTTCGDIRHDQLSAMHNASCVLVNASTDGLIRLVPLAESDGPAHSALEIDVFSDLLATRVCKQINALRPFVDGVASLKDVKNIAGGTAGTLAFLDGAPDIATLHRDEHLTIGSTLLDASNISLSARRYDTEQLTSTPVCATSANMSTTYTRAQDVPVPFCKFESRLIQIAEGGNNMPIFYEILLLTEYQYGNPDFYGAANTAAPCMRMEHLCGHAQNEFATTTSGIEAKTEYRNSDILDAVSDDASVYALPALRASLQGVLQNLTSNCAGGFSWAVAKYLYGDQYFHIGVACNFAQAEYDLNAIGSCENNGVVTGRVDSYVDYNEIEQADCDNQVSLLSEVRPQILLPIEASCGIVPASANYTIYEAPLEILDLDRAHVSTIDMMSIQDFDSYYVHIDHNHMV